MLFNFIFLYCISASLAVHDVFDFFNDDIIKDNNETIFHRAARDTKDDYEPAKTYSCEQMGNTRTSPFVVLLLLKGSGRFLGMGSIIDRFTVVTAARAVENAIQQPNRLYVLAGRVGPWWGKDSQVKRCDELRVNDDANMALIKVGKPFRFDKFVSSIKVPLKKLGDQGAFKSKFNMHYAIFGIPRSPYDIPGEATPKTSVYIMKVDTLAEKSEVFDPCIKHFPDRDFNSAINICTIANGTYTWGCIGSPTVAVTEMGPIQAATITRAPITEEDKFHIHTRLDCFVDWLRSQASITYKEDS